MSAEGYFQFEELSGPRIEAFIKATTCFYSDGLVRIFPSKCVLLNEYRKYAERIRDLKVRPDDVWIVTYPKCGTTWTQEMVWLLMNNLDFKTAKKVKQTDRSPFMEYGCMMNPTERERYKIEDSLEKTELAKSPRCIKSHLPLELLPQQLWTVKPKIIHVTREPKDVAASFYHHHRLFVGYRGSCEEFINAFIEGDVVYGSYWDHVLSFGKIRNERNTLFIRYEEMKKDLPSVVQRAAKFLNCPMDAEKLKQLCDHLSFENMRNNPMVNYDHWTYPTNRGNVEGKVEPFMRKGEIGGWKSDFTSQYGDRIDKKTLEKMKDADYTL